MAMNLTSKYILSNFNYLDLKNFHFVFMTTVIIGMFVTGHIAYESIRGQHF
jgi:hypothetical protein